MNYLFFFSYGCNIFVLSFLKYRHKYINISPDLLAKYEIPFNKVVQREGEIIVTFPRCYHAGFNHGFNCAEATNFALESWVGFGKRAIECKCRDQAMMRFNMAPFVKTYQPDQYENWLKGNFQNILFWFIKFKNFTEGVAIRLTI